MVIGVPAISPAIREPILTGGKGRGACHDPAGCEVDDSLAVCGRIGQNRLTDGVVVEPAAFDPCHDCGTLLLGDIGRPRQIIEYLGGQIIQRIGQRLRRSGQYIDDDLSGRIDIAQERALKIGLIGCSKRCRDLCRVGQDMRPVSFAVLDNQRHYALLAALDRCNGRVLERNIDIRQSHLQYLLSNLG